MISLRVRAQLEELAQQYFSGLDIAKITSYPADNDDYDVYVVEIEDGRTYWAFDDQKEIYLLNQGGIYEDFEDALDAVEQMIENSKEMMNEMTQDCRPFCQQPEMTASLSFQTVDKTPCVLKNTGDFLFQICVFDCLLAYFFPK